MSKKNRGVGCGAGLVLCVTCVMLLSGCESGGPMKIQTKWTPGVMFTDVGSTFDWAPTPRPREGSKPAVPPELDAGLRRTIEEGFAARGYRQQSPPDFLIRYYVTKTKQGDPGGFGEIQEYEEGSLLLDVLKPGTGSLLWRGWARARIDETASPAERQERGRQAVKLLLKDFPAIKQ